MARQVIRARGKGATIGWLAREGMPPRKAQPEKTDSINGVFDLGIAPPTG